MKRRLVLTGAAATALVAGGAGWWASQRPAEAAAEGEFPVSLSPEEWRARLTPAQYAVLREEATEPAYSSPLDDFWEEGIYHCAGCDTALYSSEAKYDSGTGWPSFWEPISEDRIGTKIDYKLIYPRTEVHCATCGGHLGHIFEDGPAPTGLRHCLNGVALEFRAA
jgi:peptide-methionine (R)-S-oxide reductase